MNLFTKLFTMALLYGAILLPSSLWSQTVFFTEDFEDATVSYLLSQVECNDGPDYFTRTDGSDVNGDYMNPIGTSFFAAQDTDHAPCMMTPAFMDFDDINITGQSSIQLCVYLAEDQAGNGDEDLDATDFLHIGYDIGNTGTFTPAIWVEADPATLSGTGFNGLPRIDTDFDGDGDGAEITDVFTQYCFNIPTTGALMDIQVEFAVDSGDEDMAIDELTLSGMTAAVCDVIISEVMYNPQSAEDDWEWIELYNPCAVAIDLAGYVIDDNNNTAFGAANITAGMIQPGETAILFNVDDVSAANFSAAWGTCANLIPISSWSTMGLNNGGDVLGLWSSFADYTGDNATQANVFFQLDFDDSAPWPVDNNMASIYLTDLAADPTDGANWALSTDGGTTPTGDGYTATMAGGNMGMDVGSPCVEPIVLTDVCFEDGGFFENFEISNVTGTTNVGEYDPVNEYYEINGFNGGAAGLVEIYLVSPELNYTGATALNLNVDLFEDFDDTNIDVLWSVDFAGDPATATWNTFTTFDAPDQGGADFTSSETIDMMAVTDLSSFHVAFLYTDTDNYSRWRFSNISIDSDACGCTATGATLTDITACDDNGTDDDTTDDTFTFDYTVDFMTPPATGTLDIEVFAGNVSIFTNSIPVGSLVGMTYTEMDAIGMSIGGDLRLTAQFSDDESCAFALTNAGQAPGPCSFVPCAELFFSEYIEGSGNNKCLEIYNPSQNPVDLDAGDYEVRFYFNGSTNAGNTLDLTGVIASGDVFVICDEDAVQMFLDESDLIDGGSFFNGDDAVQLSKAGATIDIVGQIGFDPGSQWGTGDVSTQNNTILRRLDVEVGDMNPSDAYDPAVDWMGFAVNFQDLGVHCGSCTAVTVTDFTSTDETCEGDADGSIAVTATSNSPLEYSFDGGATFGASNMATGLTAGCYTVIVQSPTSTGCGVTREIVIANANPSATIQVKELSFEKIGTAALAGAEIIAYDATNMQMIAASESGLQFVNVADPANPIVTMTVDPQNLGFNNSEVTSVAVNNGVIVATVPDANLQMPGDLLFFNSAGAFQNSVITGPAPDMVTFTPDGTTVLSANEGTPSDDYTVDPQGTVTIVDVATLATTQVNFTAFNLMQAALEADGVRIYGPGATVAQDLEPEHVTVSPDNATAYVSLQENNAIATIDIATGNVTSIAGLGLKQHCQIGNALDASDMDAGINIQNWPVVGMYQPDGITAFEANGQTFIITANEGDARNYAGFSEEVRIGDLTLDANTFPDAADLQMDANLGRLTTTNAEGDLDGDGDVDQLYAYGARSFSIFTTDLTQVYDSGDDLERITAAQTPTFFNAENGNTATADAQSADKGPEPEMVTVADINGQLYAFISIDQAGSGVVIYNITDPMNPYFVEYVAGLGTDISTEGLVIVPQADSPNGEFLLATMNEESGTLAIFQITDNKSECRIALMGNPQGGSGVYNGEDFEITGGTASASVSADENGDYSLFVGSAGTVDLAYTITDGNGCETTLTQTIDVADPTTCNDDISILDPCVCLDNATNGNDGQFGELIEVTGTPGQIFTVTTSTGLYVADENNIAAPAMAGVVYPLVPVTGATLVEVSPGVYHLAGVHVDGVGYSVMVTALFTGLTQTIGATCFYPELTITGLDAGLNNACLVDGTFDFSVTPDMAGVLDIMVNGVSQNTLPMAVAANSTENVSLDLATLGTGTYSIDIEFDADDAGIPNPGCVNAFNYTLQVGEPVGTMSCNDNIQLSLDEDCMIMILPDMILEGTYDNNAFAIDIDGEDDNILDATNIGDPIKVTVMDNCGPNSCWSMVTVEDKLAPTIACLDVVTICTEAIADVQQPVAFDNCDSNPTVQLIENVLADDDACDDGQVQFVQVYIAIDNQGNQSAPCERTVSVVRPPVDMVNFPDDLVWSCEQYAAHPYIIDPTRLNANIFDNLATYPLFDLTGSRDLTGIAVNNFLLTQNVEGTNPLRATGSGIPTEIDGIYCQYGYTFADEVLSTCGFAASTDSPVFKIVRTWTVLDWCSGNIITSNAMGEDNVQTIKVVDDEAPIVAGVDLTVSANIAGTHPQPCKSTGPVPMATVTDNCSGVVETAASIYVINPTMFPNATAVANVDANGIINPALPVGIYFLVYRAEDACGNVSQSNTLNLTIMDNVEPVMVCDEITQVALSSDGLAVVYAETFDDGTYDNCCLDRLEVRRMNDNCSVLGNTTFNNNNDPDDSPSDPDNGDFVTFCCEDVMATQMVVLRAYDCEGNYNECMIDVLVEDKLTPTITCPPNASLTCDEYQDDLQAALLACTDGGFAPAFDNEDECQSAALTAAGYGSPIAFDNCEVTITPTVTVATDQCGAGSVVRSFSAVDGAGNGGTGAAVCTQSIIITNVSDWVVEFPADQDGFCDQTEPDFGEPEIFFESCELIAISFEDEFFDIVSDACFKIVRQWTVINWCVVGNEIDQESNAIELAENELIPNQDLDGDGDRDGRTFRDSYRGVLPTSDTDPDADTQDGFITYQQIIKIQDDEAPVIDPLFEVEDLCIIDGNDGTDNDYSDCTFSGVLPTPDYEDCILDVNGNLDSNGDVVDNALVITATVFDADGNVVANSVVVNDLEIGCYVVRYVATDRCGNTTATDYDFCVEDCKFPTPYCVQGLVLEIMAINDPNNTDFFPMVSVWASDFDAGSFDNCDQDVDISFSTNPLDTGLVFTCNGFFPDLTPSAGGIGGHLITVYVTDDAGNQTFCETVIQIQANQDQCDNGVPLVAGTVNTEEDAGVENVEMNANGSGINSMLMTDIDGAFNMNLPYSGDYTLTPAKDVEPLNGVTTFDLVKISKHILNVELLDSPYKMIAADVNNSGNISTLDLVKLRRLILLIDTEFSNNTSWRFVDAVYEFPTSTNPWAEVFPEIININNLEADMMNGDFVGVKIGDVNGSAEANDLLGADDRTAGNITLIAKANAAKIGETVRVDFTANNFLALGMQFTLNFNQNALEFAGIENGIANDENFGLTLLEEGAITFSWNSSEAMRLTSNEVLFTLVFNSNTDAQMSELLSIDSKYTKAEAYNAGEEVLDVNLNFNGTAIAGAFELHQNRPNPFSDETTISFNLPTAQNATITVSDVSGKVLKVIQNNFAKGYNEINLFKADLNATGVLYYTLATSEDASTKMMVLMK